MGREMNNEQVVGFSPEMVDKLSRLRDQIGSMLRHPVPMKVMGPADPWLDRSKLYDIIIGDFGIKDMSKVPNPDWKSLLPEEPPKQIGNTSSLPGTDQWPNVAKMQP